MTACFWGWHSVCAQVEAKEEANMDLNDIELMVGWQQAGLQECAGCKAFFKADDGRCDFCIEAEDNLAENDLEKAA